MDASFQEKSLRVTFATVLLAFVVYFVLALPGATADIRPRQVALFVGVVVLLVVTQVAGQVVIALRDRRRDADERDRLIGLRGTRNGAFVLACGVFAALCAGLLTRGNFVFTHVLLGAWVLAQLVETGSQLWLYRREA
jgi:hypothetical protein